MMDFDREKKWKLDTYCTKSNCRKKFLSSPPLMRKQVLLRLPRSPPARESSPIRPTPHLPWTCCSAGVRGPTPAKVTRLSCHQHNNQTPDQTQSKQQGTYCVFVRNAEGAAGSCLTITSPHSFPSHKAAERDNRAHPREKQRRKQRARIPIPGRCFAACGQRKHRRHPSLHDDCTPTNPASAVANGAGSL